MTPIILIPARMASQRLPGKPLADIGGKPMIVRVAERATIADIGPVAVATDSDEIAEAVEAAGFRSVMTRADHPSGSDRIHEALGAVDPGGSHDAIVNLQGDLPMIDPDALRLVIDSLRKSGSDIATLAAPVTNDAERDNPNVVKAVLTSDDPMRALYFTRATAPSGDGVLWHHIGIYAWTRDALSRFVVLPPSALECRERLEQLRALENGMTISAAAIEAAPFGVDTPEDLERAREMASADGL